MLALQKRLISLGYWLGTANGTFGDSTQQAVYALQKAAGIGRDGIVGPITRAALAKGVVPHPQSTHGYVIEVDLQDDLVMFVLNGKLVYTLNTSTGGGYSYNDGSGDGDRRDPYRVLPHLQGGGRARGRLPRAALDAEVLHRWLRDPRRQLRTSRARLPRMRPRERRGDRVDLGVQPRSDRYGASGSTDRSGPVLHDEARSAEITARSFTSQITFGSSEAALSQSS